MGGSVVVSEVAEVLGASSLSVLCWVDQSGSPQARGVIALVRDGRPALAFTYADELVAREAGRCPQVALAVSEHRSTGSAFHPMLVAGRPRLVEDPTGDVYTSELVMQELRRYPPSRLYADSPLLMREHWWYLPRLVVEIEVDSVEPLLPRSESLDHVLVVADGRTPVVRQAGIVRGSDSRLELSVDGTAPASRDAVLFGQDASFPDLEQWSQWRYRGAWDGSAMTVEEAPARTGPGRPSGLLQRWRRQRALERRCVQAIPR